MSSKIRKILENQLEELGKEETLKNFPKTIIQDKVNAPREYVEIAEQLRIGYVEIEKPQKPKKPKKSTRGCEDVSGYGVVDFTI